MESLANRVKKDFSIIFVMSLFSGLAGFLSRVIMARNLTTAEYGLFFAVFAFISFFSAFKNLGLNQTITKFIPEFLHKKQYSKIKGSIILALVIELTISGIILIPIMLLSKYLAVHLFRNNMAPFVIISICIFYWLRPFGYLGAYISAGFQKMRYFGVVNLVKSTFVLAFILVGFNFMKSIKIPSMAFAISPILLAIVYIPLIKYKIFPKFTKTKAEINKKLATKLVKFGLPIMSMIAAGFILSYVDSIMLTYFKDLIQVGLYNAALPLIEALRYIDLALATVILPLSSELWIKKEYKELSSLLSKICKYLCVILILISLLLIIFAPYILTVLFGEKYVPATTALRILSVGVIFCAISKINMTTLVGIGEPNLSRNIIFTASITNILLNLIFIPWLGIIGASITTTSCYILMMFLSRYYVKREIERFK